MISEESGGSGTQGSSAPVKLPSSLPPCSPMGVKTEAKRVDFPRQNETEMLKMRHGNGEGTYSQGSW